MVNSKASSVLIFCTVNLPLARAIQYFSVGYGHAALVINYGMGDAEYWIDARAGGVKPRPPETNLHSAYVIRIPWDIEPGMRQLIGTLYNYRGGVAQALHFRWNDPHAVFCDQALLEASEIVGMPVCNWDREDKVTPIVACDMFVARTLGMTGRPPEVLRSF